MCPREMQVSMARPQMHFGSSWQKNMCLFLSHKTKIVLSAHLQKWMVAWSIQNMPLLRLSNALNSQDELREFSLPQKLGKKRKWACKLSPPWDKNESEIIMESWVKGGTSKQFLEKYHSNECSNAADWFDALLPLTQRDNIESIKDIDVKGSGSTKFYVSNWTTYTNCKARLSNAGNFGHRFVEWLKDIDSDDVWGFGGWSSWMDWIHHCKRLANSACNNRIQRRGMILSSKTAVLMQDANIRCSVTSLGSKIHVLFFLHKMNAPSKRLMIF